MKVIKSFQESEVWIWLVLINSIKFILLVTLCKIWLEPFTYIVLPWFFPLTVFNQGDEGKSWYIILKGSVNVVIYGKGVVCTLHEGDDFGKLALVNDSPRAASIVLREDNCHFLRVDKEDFNRILRVRNVDCDWLSYMMLFCNHFILVDLMNSHRNTKNNVQWDIFAVTVISLSNLGQSEQFWNV